MNHSDYVKADLHEDVKRLNMDYEELNNGVFHQTLFLPNKGQSNADMAKLEQLMLSPCTDTSLMGNSFFTYV